MDSISQLILNDCWREVLGLARWRSFVYTLPPNFQDSLSWQPNHEHLAVDEKLSPNRLLYVADQLKEWAVPLLTAHGDRGDDLKIALEGAVCFLQGTAKQLGGPPAGHMSKVSNPKHNKHTAMHLLRALLLSRLVRDSRHFPRSGGTFCCTSFSSPCRTCQTFAGLWSSFPPFISKHFKG